MRTKLAIAALSCVLAGPALAQSEPLRTGAVSVQATRAARGHYQKAAKAFEERKLDETVELLDKALALWPDFSDAHFLRAKVAYYQKSYADAARHMTRAEQGFVAGLALHAETDRLRRQEWERSRDSHRYRLDALRGQLSQATTDEQRRFIQQQIDDAQRGVDDAQREISAPPEEVSSDLPPDYHFFAGNILLRLGRRDDAAKRYEQAIAAKPDHADAVNNLANLYLDAGQALRALDVLTKAEGRGVKVNPALKQAVVDAVGD
ncbi:MAG: tetratricopeptide repeat protein [Vicinamibacteria bacterium]|jgi:tetratricopeptide (TPR) repeat protein|nr:tetratricopeptide repeat protein [Vicinamibacteria bacterium]